MHIEADVVLAPEPPFARVQPHSDADMRSGGPRGGVDRSLGCGRCGYAGRRGWEDGEDAVTLGADLGAALPLYCGSNDLAMGR